MELRRYLALLRRRIWLITIIVVVAATAAFLSTPRTSQYTAESTLYVGSRQLGAVSNGLVSADSLLGLQQVIQTFSKMIDSRPIAADAIDRTGLQWSVKKVLDSTTVTTDQGTQLLRIQVTATQPEAAQSLANGLADAFVAKIKSFEPTADPRPGEVPQLPAYVFERASVPTDPQPSPLPRRLLLGILFGLVVAVGVVFLREYLDVTIKGVADVERLLELPVLAVIPLEPELAAAPPPREPQRAVRAV